MKKVKLWTLKLTNENSSSTGVFIENLKLQKGDQLLIYDDKKETIYGPINSSNFDGGSLLSHEFEGQTIVLKYFSQLNNEAPNFKITYVTNGIQKSCSEPSGTDPCNQDYRCLSSAWDTQGRSVGVWTYRNYFAGNYYTTYCTATLINNTSQDGRPILLTASHCRPKGTTCSNDQSEYWNSTITFKYYSTSCTNLIPQTGYVSFTNIRRLAWWYSNNSNLSCSVNIDQNGGDYQLLEINYSSLLYISNALVCNGISYSSWSRENRYPNYSLSLHHPCGSTLKYSQENQTACITTYLGSTCESSFSTFNNNNYLMNIKELSDS